MRSSCRRRWSDERGGVGSLIEILVVTAIIVLLAYYFIGRPNKQGETTPVAVKKSALGAACRANLQQARTAIGMYRDQHDGQNPPSMSAVDLGVPPDFLQCPVGKADYPYVYDPATGEIHCRYPGHERY
jgi:type II secretory pathway pseudopilin PulG